MRCKIRSMKVLSPTDSLFLWIETRNQPMHVAGLNLYSPPPGAGPDFVARLLADWCRLDSYSLISENKSCSR